MKFSSEGFLEPFIDLDQCVDCGLCQRRCPQNNLKVYPLSEKVFAVKSKNDKELYKSASGGAFAALARYFLEQNGVCVGASYYKGWNVGHKIIRSLDDLPSLQSSKYVQSDTLHTYSEVRCLLSQGIKVLYSGTPCQIAGLNSFLGNFRDKSSGWGLNVKIKTKTKTKTRSCVIDPYYYHFLKGDTYRECCYRCSYSRPERVGDVTIGDFWGI